MPVLKNHKWERFAQELAKGKTADEAYQNAGYEENRGNAARLKANESVMKRVEELQGKTAEITAVTASDLTMKLMEIAREAFNIESVGGLNVARNAYMDIAKLNGLIIDRAETSTTVKDISDKPLSENEWKQQHTAG